MEQLIGKANHIRDKAIITLFTKSGLRLSELTNINTRVIRVSGKGERKPMLRLVSYQKSILGNGLPSINPMAVSVV